MRDYGEGFEQEWTKREATPAERDANNHAIACSARGHGEAKGASPSTVATTGHHHRHLTEELT